MKQKLTQTPFLFQNDSDNAKPAEEELSPEKKKELMKDLPTLFKKIQEEHLVSPSDIPSVTAMQEKLAVHDFSKFPNLKPKLIEVSDLR